MLFPRLFLQSASRTPDRLALVELQSDREFTYRELKEHACLVATSLRDRGIEKGDRVGICTGNRFEHVVTYLATQLIGAVTVPFNFRLPSGSVQYHLGDAKPEILLFDSLSRDAVLPIVDEITPSLVYAGEDVPSGITPFDAFLDGKRIDPEIVVDGQDLSAILYSSGTTGNPKGIPIDHRNCTSRIMTNSLGQHYYLGEIIPGAMPLYHTVGMHGVLGCVLGMSGTYLTMPSFDPERYTKAIGEYEITALHEAPTIFRAILTSDAIHATDVSSVTTLGFSGAPMNTDTFVRLKEVFEPNHFANLYGTTEVYGTLAYLDLMDLNNPNVVGKANVFIETRVVELNSNDPEAVVEPGVEGELIVNTESPVSFEGYLNKPERTEEAIHNGWFFTGDAVYERDDDSLVITGRADDVIISGGENIHPANVEDTIAAHPEVHDVGVVGIPDEDMGETVLAVVNASEGVTESELDRWCREDEELPNFCRPRHYRFVEEIPRNPSGKVMRYKLRDEMT